ncbi:MAG: sugar phosphate isomerase/epimerase [Akkermansiaceae bacterium]|nr:sugar phosphate isomerase/epimerase [Akkermansiaceae bacterium]
MNRRKFLRHSATAAGLTLAPPLFADPVKTKPLFDISLAEWSLHRALNGGKMTNLDFPQVTKERYGITAVEYVNRFFKDKAKDTAYLSDLKTRCDDLNVSSVLIMVDGEGRIGLASAKERQKVVDNHKKWVEAAKFLGCHSIRVNAHGEGDTDAAKATNTVRGLAALSKFAKAHGINVIVENHGGLSSNGKWLAGVLKEVGMNNCGALPDFGNFHSYDRYLGIKETMPFAKGVSAKSHDFDKEGNETRTDFRKAMKIVLDAGYRGYVGVEYEGKALSEPDGIIATRDLLIKVREELAKDYK